MLLPDGGELDEGGQSVGIVLGGDSMCHYCGSLIADTDVIVGRLTLRKRGAGGLPREMELILHAACVKKLTKNSTPSARRRRLPVPVTGNRGSRALQVTLSEDEI